MSPKTAKNSVRPITKPAKKEGASAKSKGTTTTTSSSSTSSSFDGFSEDTIEYFKKLKKHNVREWFQANKEFYETHVSEPMTKLALELQPTFGAIKVYRPYRDVRFSADKSPLKEHCAMSSPGAGKSGCGGYYFHVKETEYMMATGMYVPDAKQLNKFRQLVATPAEALKIHALLDELAQHGFVLVEEGKLTSAPKGYSKDHAEINLLRYKSLAISYKRPIDDNLFDGAACLKLVKDGWTLAGKWSKWLDENVM